MSILFISDIGVINSILSSLFFLSWPVLRLQCKIWAKLLDLRSHTIAWFHFTKWDRYAFNIWVFDTELTSFHKKKTRYHMRQLRVDRQLLAYYSVDLVCMSMYSCVVIASKHSRLLCWGEKSFKNCFKTDRVMSKEWKYKTLKMH